MRIYYGASSPIDVKGKKQCSYLEFAYENKGWHYMPDKSSDIKAVLALEKKGCIEIKDGRYKFKFPEP